MTNNPRKVVGFFALLLGLWIITYWMWSPARPEITFGEPPAGFEPPPLTAVDSAPPVRTEAPRVQAPPPAAPPARTITAIERPEFREYTVRRGDTSFEAIAARSDVFGDARLGKTIQAANPLVSPHKLIPGRTVLKIPLDPQNIQGRIVTIQPKAQPEPVPPPPADAASKDTVYVVQSGDTLSGIAKTVYGRSALWERILEANRDQISDPGKIRAGMKLRIPPAPASPGPQ